MKDKKVEQAAAKVEHLKRIKEAKERRRTAPDLERASPTEELRPRILIYCEGRNTEPDYFNHFRTTSVEIKCFGEGRNTRSLVERAIELREQAAQDRKPYDQIWCVFDRDPPRTNGGGHSAKNFNEAVALALREGIKVAYSIQAFEYWLILHFNDHQGGPLPRDDYDQLLNKYLGPLGCRYDGNEGTKRITRAIFDLLEATDLKTGKPRREMAIRRAERIHEAKAPHHNPAAEESTTTIYQLVRVIKPI